MLENIQVMATTFKTRDVSLNNGVVVVKEGVFLPTKYSGADIISLEIANEDNTKKLGGTLMGAAIGGALTGGFGAVVGAMAGGNTNLITFIASFKDGNQLMGQCSQKAYLELVASVKQAEFDRMPKPVINKVSLKEHFKSAFLDGFGSSTKKDEKSKSFFTEAKEALGGLIILLIIGFFVWGYFTQDDKKEVLPNEPIQQVISAEQSSSVPPKPVDPKTKISKDAVEVMEAGFYPKAFKKYGKTYMARVNKLAPQVAFEIAKNKSCDRVEVVTFSQKSTKEEIVWVIDCANKNRYYLSELELAKK